ncbi:uncharacterized protein LOC121366398 [Gigantopelta aegis]|uniref:uncharacterized protein LOC121366398 n=1 Tax=Gigantopelta aegis TaxID=1735272 RepID=UPI001B88E50C|nr:uncharacterized protein LOC121366398 [Gigantopelta aegis]
MAVSWLDRVYLVGLQILVFFISGLNATYCASYSTSGGTDNYVYRDCLYGCCGTSRDLYCCSFSVGTTVGYSIGGFLLLLVISLYCCIRRRQLLAKSRPVTHTTGPNSVPCVYQTSSNGNTTNNGLPQPYLLPGSLGYADSVPLSYIGSYPTAAGGSMPLEFIPQPPAFVGQPPAYLGPPPAYSEVVSKTDTSSPPAYDNTGFNH